jgi:KipI family sensor histidine kinase inhibitor
MIPPDVHRYGKRAVMLEWNCGEATATNAPLAFAAWVRRNAELMSRLVDVVPGARTVVLVSDASHVDAVVSLVGDFTGENEIVAEGRHRDIDVKYDGEDLTMVADAAACSIEEVITLHSTPVYCVAFCGFSPGFGYLSGLHPRLHLPRRPSPRTAVPSGSVAIAGEYSAVYPSASPGGWNLLGRTSRSLWDLDRADPALLQPGDTVRFVPRRTV